MKKGGEIIMGKTVTIQKTAKIWKLQLVFSTLFIVVGFFLVLPALYRPDLWFLGLPLMLGIAWKIFVRVMIWWHHD